MTDELSSRYLLLKPLGEGPVGVTWRARTLATGETVAVKVLHRGIAERPEAGARFDAESPVLRAYFDKRVVRAREVVRGPGVIALVGELVEGDSLASLLARSGPLPQDKALWVAAELAAALAAIHATNVVHCDLTPSNVLVAADHETLHVTDLRIARVAFGFRGGAAAFGTDGYATPDRSAKAATSPEADIYAFGVMIAEALSGRRPGPDDPLTELPNTVRGLLAACVSREPANRPTAAAIVACLGDPSHRPGPIPERRRARARTARPVPGAPAADGPGTDSAHPHRPYADSPAGPGRRAPTRLRRLWPLATLALLGAGLIGTTGAIWLPAADRSPASASETPSAPVAVLAPDPPDAMPTASNSAEFARHWFAALDFAVRTGDTGPLRAASAESCETCAKAVATVEHAFADGGFLRGGGYDVRTVTATGFWSLDHPTLDVVFDRAPRSAHAGAGGDPAVALPGAVFVTCQVTLVWKSGRWFVSTVLADEAVA